MQRLTIALFTLLAVFAHLVPVASARAIELAKRETNADRFARGLPPLPPTRRDTAKRGSPSRVSLAAAAVQKSQTGRIQIRDAHSGYAYGYLENSPYGPHGVNHGHSDMWVTYDYNRKSLHCKSPAFHDGGDYLGGVIPDYNLGQGYSYYVPLTNVEYDDYDGISPDGVVNKYADVVFADEARIWNYHYDSGELTGWWENKDHYHVPVSYAYNPDTNIIVIVGDIDAYLYEYHGWYEVIAHLTAPG
ncbi:hypothetical protein BJV78DRAFT_1155620 [Lactifluus subvellereus]|nr:hypothetical protein BJV78DRAFT_1155620 [Lactifluus subvellereus]